MPIDLESGLLLLKPEERKRYKQAAQWLFEQEGKSLDLSRPLTLGDFADLLFASCVVERDAEGLRQLINATEVELKKRESPH